MGKPSFAIVGCGTLGMALGRLLFQAGYPVAGVASKSLSSAQRVAQELETEAFSTRPWEITQKADLIFLTTPDDAVEPVCRAIAENGGFTPGSVVLHSSGALSSEILDSAREKGAFAGSLHPMQSFAGARPGVNLFSGILVTVEGDPEALVPARQVAADLGAHHARVNPKAKALYHAAAVTASNYLVTLLHMAFTFNEAAEITPEQSLQGLYPLIQGTLSNIREKGIPMALTGPIARGDVSTVERHLAEIEALTPELLPLYKRLGAHTVPLAVKKGGLSEETAKRLAELLKD